jgi:plastocyanin
VRRQLSFILLYSLSAALVLSAPLAASEQPPQAVIEEAVPPAEPEVAGEPEALSGEASLADEPPQEATPEPSPKTRPVVAKAAPGTVTISDFEFTPASITVNVGDTVTWSNAGPTPHSATGESFDTKIFEEGESRSQTFSEAGTFDYICTPHPNMQGTVIVRAAAAQGEDDDEGSTEAGAADDGSAAAGDGSATGDTGAATDSAAGPTLPATGVDAGGVFALGLITLALGAFLRRRTSATG